MKLKMDEKNAVVVQDGKPVYIDEDGKEIAFDAPATRATIARLNGEAKGHRERAESFEERLKAFEGIDDPEKARSALNTIANLDAKKLIDAGEVDKVRQEAQRAFDEQLKSLQKKHKPVEEERDRLAGELTSERIGNAFGKSKFIAEKLAIPVDLAQAKFGNNFFIKDGKIQAKGYDGNPVYSKERPGELADFDEALSIIVEGYSHRDSILKGTGASGGGAGGTGGAGGKRTMSRKAFEALAPADQMAAAKEVQITD